jgi:hypothetical protein
MWRRRFAILASAVCALSVGPADAADSVRPADVGRLAALIKPKPDEEKWARIPWLTSLWEARQRAAAEGKPILLWEMDGNPLGCT